MFSGNQTLGMWRAGAAASQNKEGASRLHSKHTLLDDFQWQGWARVKVCKIRPLQTRRANTRALGLRPEHLDFVRRKRQALELRACPVNRKNLGFRSDFPRDEHCEPGKLTGFFPASFAHLRTGKPQSEYLPRGLDRKCQQWCQAPLHPILREIPWSFSLPRTEAGDLVVGTGKSRLPGGNCLGLDCRLV